MNLNYNARYVAVYSPEWRESLRFGWITTEVNDGVAKMIKKRSGWDIADDKWRSYQRSLNRGPLFMGD